MTALRPLHKIARSILLRLQRQSEVARFDGIIIADPQQGLAFRKLMLAALQLIKESNARRFLRIQRYITWIVNVPLPYGGAEYDYSTRTCRVDFEDESISSDATTECACMLVHEATHGFIRSRGILYSADLRSRIERCCVKEEQRFLSRAGNSRPEIIKALCRDFDESRWHRIWHDSTLQSLVALIRRLRRERNTRETSVR